ncbi:hypothetical protein [Streptomyces zaomyceticus]|uniref:hypothetical protein n=1 Tax=Streptomyces zaomyceticus TaxID=68286 RepID=UPI0016753051|nr:hypothetical protein [Streptomyces zaomyceticus]GHG41885.1 hypothetical protein GCM10018791_70250 [Streptomyces zaomyceticus]
MRDLFLRAGREGPRHSGRAERGWDGLEWSKLPHQSRSRWPGSPQGIVGLYLTRTGVHESWPVEDFLDLLGTCRRDLTELRGVLAELLTGCPVCLPPLPEARVLHR